MAEPLPILVSNTKADIPMVDIVIDERYCKGCALCIHFCKVKIFKISNKTNSMGSLLPCVRKPEKCTVCKMCERICPEFAITVDED
jgi:2-oxoglutarate ferredoxin oxidoreductase subunit delta